MIDYKPIKKSNLASSTIVVCFLFCNTLYYFLRFQLGLDAFVLSIYLVGQLLISLVAVEAVYQMCLGRVKVHFIDFICLLLVIIFCYLFVITIIRTPSLIAGAYSMKDYLFPVLFYFYCRKALITDHNWKVMIGFFSLVSTFIALVYFFEFYQVVYLGEEPMPFTQEIRQLLVKNSAVRADHVFASHMVDGLRLFRLEGILGHNNATGLCLALGVIACFFSAKISKNRIYYILLLINLLALGLTAARTSLFALVIGSFIYTLIKRRKIDKNKRVTLGVALKATLFSCIICLGAIWIFFWSPLSFLFTGERLQAPLVIMFNAPEFTAFREFLANPLLWIGIGFPVIGISSDTYGVIRSDDVYFVQLISMFGIPGIALFFFGSVGIFLKFRRYSGALLHSRELIMGFGFLVVLVAFITIIHASTLVRPQIYPIVFLGLAAIRYGFANTSVDTPKPVNELAAD